ncbi:MAG TPA: hypothetical protein VN699_20845, partial [Pirellulales bacterium]|nr:hypothetical protein [Pirellulales bacterium]
MRWFAITALVCACAAATVAARAVAAEHDRVTLTLVGGAKISATLLRENNEGVVVDLGYDVLHVPKARVLSMARDEAAGASSSANDRGIF